MKTKFIDQKFNNIRLAARNSDNNLIPENIAQQLIAAISELPGGIFYWKNKEGVYLWHNLFKEEDLQKYQWPSSIVGKTDYDLFPQNVAEECQRHDLETMLSDDKIIKEEVVRCLTGEEYTQLSYKRALKDEQGKTIGIVGNLVDLASISGKNLSKNYHIDHFNDQNKFRSNMLNSLQKYINEPLKEILLLVNIIASNEDRDDHLELISEIKSFIKTLLKNYDNILKEDLTLPKN